MTDIQTIRAMLTRAGLSYAEGSHTDDDEVMYDIITMAEDKGYRGFVAEFWFDKTTGALKHTAAWE